MFELEATEETVQAAQQEQQQPCPFGEFDATTTRIESSVFIPVVLTLFPIWKGEIFINLLCLELGRLATRPPRGCVTERPFQKDIFHE